MFLQVADSTEDFYDKFQSYPNKGSDWIGDFFSAWLVVWVSKTLKQQVRQNFFK